MIVPLQCGIYITEAAASPESRERIVSLDSACVTGNQLFAAALDTVLSSMDDGWWYMVGLAAGPVVGTPVHRVPLPARKTAVSTEQRSNDAAMGRAYAHSRHAGG